MTEPTFSLHSEGPAEGRTLLFIHGWPDDPAIWDRQVAYFRDRYRCVRLELPNFGAHLDAPRGFDFPELAGGIAQVVERLSREGGGERIVLIGHDWGAFLAYLVDERISERVERMVTLDVGAHVDVRSAKEAAMILGYQWPLIAAWLMGGVIPSLGERITQSIARKVRAPLDRLDRHPGSRSLAIDGGHWMMLSHPDQVNSAIDGFLREAA